MTLKIDHPGRARPGVKGPVEDVAVIGGRPLGVHLREEDLYVKR